MHVLVAERGIGGVGHCRIEQAVRANALSDRVEEISFDHGTNAGFDIRRDVGRYERTEGRVDLVPAREIELVAGSTIRQAHDVLAPSDGDLVCAPKIRERNLVICDIRA